MPLESIILPHCLLTHMKNCITLLDMIQLFSSMISENIDDIKSQYIVPDVDCDCDIIHTHSTNKYNKSNVTLVS